MQAAILIVLAYLALGFVVSVPFLFGAVKRMDAFARDGSFGFRLAVLPGAVALWPLLAARWLRGGPPPVESNAHRHAVGRPVIGGGHGR